MKHSLRYLFVLLLFPALLSAQEPNLDVSSYGLSTELPINPKIRYGTLENGMRFYIMKNQKPENRASLRMVTNAGSVLETDAQVGLAHFVEHMAFNGTEHFEKDALVKYLESIGTRFGADLNAYTSFDETVYMLEVPTDKEELIDKGLLVLRDWATAVTLDDEEIDKERGVIIEEWRQRNGAGQRMLEKQLPVLLKGSKYADRLPIGTKENLESFEYETLKSFYREWYRPDLQAVIAVGDFDMDEMEAKIREQFGSIEKRDEPVVRPTFDVPDHREMLFAIATDPEATSSSVSLYIKHKPDVDEKVKDYRKSIVEGLYSSMLNERLDELLQQADPPYLGAYSGKGGFVREKDFYQLTAMAKDGEIERGFEALLTESERVRRHGFVATEMERAKTNILTRIEQLYNEREKTNSGSHASEFIRHFLKKEPIPGIEIEFEIYKKYLPTITLMEVNRVASKMLVDKNRVVMLSMPEKDGVEVPTEAQLQAVIDGVMKKDIEAYVDKVPQKPLLETLPTGSPVVEEKKIEELDMVEWKLQNGVRVILKSTDFKADQILVGATSPGGNSLYGDDEVTTASMAASLIDEGGISEFDQLELRKMLTGKTVRVSPVIGSLAEGFSGSVAPKDKETLLQLIYLYFNAPRKDEEAATSYLDRIKNMIKNFGNMPERVWSDTLTVALADYHPRRKPMTVEELDKVTLDRAMEIYRERFANADDFTFYFVGNFTYDEMKPLVEQYLGALPSTGRVETWKDNGVKPPKGVVDKIVRKGIDQKSRMGVFFTGDFEFSYHNRIVLDALEQLMNTKLREEIREEEGGTYGVQVGSNGSRYPNERYILYVMFGCDPERVDELTETMFGVLENIRTTECSDEDLGKIKEIKRRQRETAMKENNFWIGQIDYAIENDVPMTEFLKLDEEIEKLTAKDIQEAAQKYIDVENYVRVVLMPEKEAEDATVEEED